MLLRVDAAMVAAPAFIKSGADAADYAAIRFTA